MNQKNWFSEARFGMMLHWGLYSLLGGEYKGEQMGNGDDGRLCELGEWAQSYFRIPKAEYEKLAKAFDPIAFDAEEYVLLAKRAGMRYLVVTSKHHEGFAMFDSEADPFNVVKASPFGRDPIRELALACKKHGLKLGLYYSQELDWHEPDGGGYDKGLKNARSNWSNDWDFPDKTKKDFSRCFRKKILPQVRELLTNYGEIALIWFDTPGVITPEQSRELYELVKELQPNCLVNSRIGNGMGDYASLGDNQIPSDKEDASGLYETAATINNTWGYKSYDQNWKSPREVLTLLTRLASRNVNYLLNIGPDHLGRLPVGAQDTLKEVGKWMDVNAEAIYGTGPSPYSAALPGCSVTEGDNCLYLILETPERVFRIPGVLSEPERAELLGIGDLPFTKRGELLELTLPELADRILPVLKVSFREKVRVRGGLFELPDGSVSLAPQTAKITGNIRVSKACDVENWIEDGELAWNVDAAEEGSFACRMTVNGYHGTDPVEAALILSVNGDDRKVFARHNRDQDALIARHHRGMLSDVGSVSLRKGENRITLRLAKKVDRDMFRFAALRLTRME